MDGRQATTRWEDADKLARRYPAVQVERDRIFVRDGSTYTSARATAGLDLALAWVEEDFGQDVALAIARRLVMFSKRSGAQPQISAHLMAQVPAMTTVQQAIERVLEDPAGNHSVIELAKRAAMSERNFSRVFRRQTTMTSAEFVETARVQAARRMLEDTDVSLQRHAYRCGFGNVDAMRRAFVRNLGMRPT